MPGLCLLDVCGPLGSGGALAGLWRGSGGALAALWARSTRQPSRTGQNPARRSLAAEPGRVEKQVSFRAASRRISCASIQFWVIPAFGSGDSACLKPHLITSNGGGVLNVKNPVIAPDSMLEGSSLCNDPKIQVGGGGFSKPSTIPHRHKGFPKLKNKTRESGD